MPTAQSPDGPGFGLDAAHRAGRGLAPLAALMHWLQASCIGIRNSDQELDLRLRNAAAQTVPAPL